MIVIVGTGIVSIVPSRNALAQFEPENVASYLGANTRLRFVASPTMDAADALFVDNVYLWGNDDVITAAGGGSAPPYSEYPALIGADLLHDQGITGDGVGVAVIDTGLWPWHSLVEDTAGNSRLAVRYNAITDQLHVQNEKTYVYELLSRDVLHDFSVPVFRLKQDAIPGRVITGWFRPILEGEYDIQCAEICGIGHGLMPARLFVESPAAHAA